MATLLSIYSVIDSEYSQCAVVDKMTGAPFHLSEEQ